MKENSERPITITGDHSKLATQSRGRDLSEAEVGLTKALIQTFAKGEHDFTVVVSRLNEAKIPRPSGESGEWTISALENELRQLNVSLDEAYAKNGFGG
jgi:hypothetical protein